MKNYIIVAIVIILIIAGVVWYSNKGAVAPVDTASTTDTLTTSDVVATTSVETGADATTTAQ